MRAYFFGNMYLSSIQQGIQAAHVTAELFVKAHGEKANYDLIEWAVNHKTMILLNAGYSDAIRGLVTFFDSEENPYAWAQFHEGQDALDGALTCAGIILPEKIYTLSSWMGERDPNDWRVSQVVNYKNIYMTPSTGLASSVGAPGRNDAEWTYTDWEIELASRMMKFGLAR